MSFAVHGLCAVVMFAFTYSKFAMMFAVMRIENQLIVMKRQAHEEPKMGPKEIASKGASDDRLISFVSSNACTSSGLPPEITADFISDTYLCLQIDAIDGILHQMSSNSFPVEEPLEEYLLPYRPILPHVQSHDKDSIRRKVILQSLKIQSYLWGDSDNLSIQAGAWSMVNLSGDLYMLKMYNEALITGKWTVNLFRTLAKANLDIYLPYLVHGLQILSRFYIQVDDLEGAMSAIEEAVGVSRSLQSSSTNIRIEFQLGGALTTLAFTWGLKDNKEASLKAAQESVQIYENALERNCKRLHQISSSSVHSIQFPLAAWFEDVPHEAISDYGRALDRLSLSFEALGYLEVAFKFAKKALDVMVFSTYSFCDESLAIEIASMFYRIAQQDFHEFMSLEQALYYAKQAVTLFRLRMSKDIAERGHFLCYALSEQANILGKLKRWDEALVLWKEAAELAKEIMNDQLFRGEALSRLSWGLRQLKRHDEAVSTRQELLTFYSRSKGRSSYKEAQGHFDLGVELRLAGRLSEAIIALHSALTQYRVLAFKEPEVYTKKIGKTLNQLIITYIHDRQFDHAFNEGHESLKLHESILGKDPSILAECILAMRFNSLAAEVSDDEVKCVGRARYNIECARRVANVNPEEGNIVSEMVQAFAAVLCRFDRISEASAVIEEALESHSKHLPGNGTQVEQYMDCLITKATIIFDQGDFQSSAEYIQKSIDIGTPHASHKSVSSTMLRSLWHRVEILCTIGQTADAVKASKKCLDFARRMDMESHPTFIQCLLMTAMAFRYDGRYAEATVYSQKALELSRSDAIIASSMDQPQVLLLELDTLTFLSDTLADAGMEEQALIEGKSAVDKALALRSKYATLPWSDIEMTYVNALEAYGLRLAASGNILGALHQLVQVQSYDESRINFRLGDSISLANVLYTQGILYCAAGQPVSGASAISRLHDLKQRLSLVHPEVAQCVEISLKRHREFPSWTALLRQLSLKCNHEHE